MKRYLCILAILAAIPCKNTCAQAIDSAKIIKSLNKCWRSLSHEYSTIYGLEEEEIKRYSKQRLCFNRDSISMYLGVTYAPKYAIRRVNTENYAKNNFDCSKQKLGIVMDSVYEITISSMTRPAKDGKVFKMTDIIAYDGECIYVSNDGVIFKLFDADAKAQGRSAN